MKQPEVTAETIEPSLGSPPELEAEDSSLDGGASDPALDELDALELKVPDRGANETPQSKSVAAVESDPETPEPVPSLDTPQARFSAFRSWLDEQGPRYQVWANDCIFIATSPPFLELEFPKGFRHSHVSASDRDELLLQGVEQFFPDCSRVRVRNRAADSDRLTHRETVAKEAAEAQSALEQLIADHADIQSIAAHFDAAIQSVHKDHRAPLPPVLSGEEGA